MARIENCTHFAARGAEIDLGWSSSSPADDATPRALRWRTESCTATAARMIDVFLHRAGSETMKSALVLAAAANALVAPSAPAASTVVRQGVIQTPPILTREDGLETRPMAADSA